MPTDRGMGKENVVYLYRAIKRNEIAICSNMDGPRDYMLSEARNRRQIPYHLCACMLGRFSHVQLFAALLTVVCQASLSMGFSRQVYWSGLPCPPPGDLSNRGIKPGSPVFSALAGGLFTI